MSLPSATPTTGLSEDQARLNLAAALADLAVDKDAHTKAAIAELGRAAALVIPDGNKAELIAGLARQLEALGEAPAAPATAPPADPPVVRDGVAIAMPPAPPPSALPSAPPPPDALEATARAELAARTPPARPVVAEVVEAPTGRLDRATANARAELEAAAAKARSLGIEPMDALARPRQVIDVPSNVRIAKPMTSQGATAYAPQLVVDGVAVANDNAAPPPGARRHVLGEYTVETPAGAVVHRAGVAVAIGTTPVRAPALPPGVHRPAPGPVSAEPPPTVQGNGAAVVARSAPSGAPSPSVLTAQAGAARDTVQTAVMGLQHAIQHHLSADHPKRRELLSRASEVSQAVAALAATIATMSHELPASSDPQPGA